ncbi:hypothetical protein D7X48_05720 [bacterium D16-50]|nr:hypothetical protein D7X48_05720 [bacterium D16-50]
MEKTTTKTAYCRASLTYRRKHISLGSFPTEKAAHDAYLEGRRILHDYSCTLGSYRPASPLAFAKWVSLLNFRDNGAYFSNPIYLAGRMFYYYLSPSRILKFDQDDLSYYAAHKIMCRGNHYFVADYGSQISISSRYRIRPYAREGKDFRFLNGDSNDFRRENLEILNIYHGVTPEMKNGQYVYTVRIHVRGNYLVGRYVSMTEAAIAYNKAVDILRENGFSKNYSVNYIEGLPSGKYAELYDRLQISARIRSCRP